MMKKFLRVEVYENTYLFIKKRINSITKEDFTICISMQEDERYVFNFQSKNELDECFLSIMKQMKIR
jgi:hypothetical protein